MEMGEALSGAFFNLFTHSPSSSELNTDSFTYLKTLVEAVTSLCRVLWAQNQELLHMSCYTDVEGLRTCLKTCSACVRRGTEVLEVLDQDHDDLLLEYEEGDFEQNVQDWYETFTTLIAACTSFADNEKWAKHKANHVSSTDGGGGVSVLEHKVKLYRAFSFSMVAYYLSALI